MPTNPVPIVVEPSGEFLGNDGAWSPFLVKVGTPPTPLQLLASTEIPETWVVVPLGCQGAAVNCSDARGGIFDLDGSRTWSNKSGENSIYKINAEVNLQLDVNALYGFDTVQIGSPGESNATVEHQVVAGMAAPELYLGSLGLHNRNVVFQPDQLRGEQSFISLLSSTKQIPSLSYGFFAGASYRRANASLILGGYDAVRFTPNDVEFTFTTNQFRQKLIGLQSIWYTNTNSDRILLPLPKPIMTLVDSTVPHIWLPPETCKEFEKAFGLTYNPIANLYLINDTIHNTLLKQNPSIIFQISNNGGPGRAVNITLPYASFDLEVKGGYYPGVSKNSRYFPLRQASQGEEQYTLGRTFLQESYLIVNYEHRNFSISQVKSSNDIPKIVPIAAAPAPTSTGSSSLPTNITKSTSTPSTSSGPSGGSKSLATPAIAGIAIAIVVVIFAAFGIWICRRRRQRKRLMKETPEFPADHIHNAAELDLNGKQGNEKNPGLMVTEHSSEKIQSDYDKNRSLMEQAGHDPAELAGALGSDFLRPELPSADPSNRHELSSSETDVIRSELSTPEPHWPAEMPSPEIGASELGGSTVRGNSSEGRADSPTFSLWSQERTQAASHRTVVGHGSIDSNASDDNNNNNNNNNINWAAIPGSIIPASSSHSRMPSSNYSTASNSRPPHTRLDSTSSSISSSSLLPRGVGPSYTHCSTRPPHSRMGSNTSDTPSLPTPSTISRRHSMPYPFPRPPHRRLDSKDSAETFETRLEISPPISPYLPPPSAASSSSSARVNNNPSNRGAVFVEALPSTWMPGDGDGEGTTPSFIIHHHRHNSRNSIRSALRSPDLLDPAGFGVAEVDEENHEDDDDDGVKEGREADEEAEVVSQGGGILSEEPGEIIEAQQQQEQQEEKGVHAVRGEEVSEATKLMAGEKGK